MATKRPAADLEVQLADAKAELREAARELLSQKLIIAALLKRQKPAAQVTLSREEMAVVIGTDGLSIERVSDGVRGDLLVRLATKDEDGPIIETPKGAGRG